MRMMIGVGSNSNHHFAILVKPVEPARASRIYNEFSFALSKSDPSVIRAWGRRSAVRLLQIVARRVGGLPLLVVDLAIFMGSEAGGIYRAVRTDQLVMYLKQRIGSAWESAILDDMAGFRSLMEIMRLLKGKPKSAARKILEWVLEHPGKFSMSCDERPGGFKNRLLRRKKQLPITPAMIAVIVAEGVFLALLDLVAVIHACLPQHHDPIWDTFLRFARPVKDSAPFGL